MFAETCLLTDEMGAMYRAYERESKTEVSVPTLVWYQYD